MGKFTSYRYYLGTYTKRFTAGALSLIIGLSGLVAAAPLLFSQTATAAPSTVAYSTMPTTLPGSFPSQGYEATQTSELGDYVRLAGTNRKLSSVRVSLTSWACENDFTKSGHDWVRNRAGTDACVTTPGSHYKHDITLNIYNVDTSSGTPVAGTLIRSVTKNVTVPFRPSYDPANTHGCAAPAADIPFGGTWYDPVTDSCVHGQAFDVTFNGLTAANAILPNDIIVAIAYNTSHYGTDPIGQSGPYDSLNLSLTTSTPSTGTNPESDAVFWRKAAGALNRDTGWGGYTPVMEVTTLPSMPPAAPSNLTFVQGTNTFLCDGSAATNSNSSGTLHWATPTDSVNQYALTPNYPDNTGEHPFYASGSATSAWVTGNFAHHGQGTYSYTIKAQGTNGLWGPTATCDVIYDATAPTVTFTSPDNGAYVHNLEIGVSMDGTYSNLIQYGFDVTGPNGVHFSTVNYQVSKPNVTLTDFDLCAAAHYGSCPSTLPEGMYTVRAKAYDAAGNRNISTYRTFVVDNSAPTIAFITPATDGTLHSGDLNVQVHATDNFDLNTVTVHLYNTNGTVATSDDTLLLSGCSSVTGSFGTTKDYSCTIDTAGYSDGTYRLLAASEDQTGKVVTVSRTVEFDNTAPQANISVSPLHNGKYVTKTVTVTGNVDPSEHHMKSHWFEITGPNGYSYHAYDMNNGTNSWSFNWNTAGLQDGGVYTIRYVAADSVGNRSDDPNYSNPTTFKVTVDNHGPQAHFTSAPPTFVNSDFTVSATASDNVALRDVFFDVRDNNGWVAGCKAGTFTSTPTTIAGSTNVNLSCTINTANLVDGQAYTLRVHAGDMAGYGGGEQQTINIDRTDPGQVQGLAVFDSNGQVTTGVTKDYNVTAKWDAISDAAKYEYCYWNDISTSAYRESNCYTTYPNLNQQSGSFTEGEGMHHLKVRAIDPAGNVGPWSSTVDIFYLKNDAAVVGENFNTHNDSDYKGINVGFHLDYFKTVSGVSVSLYDGPDVMVTNTQNQKLLDLIQSGTTQLSTPFITDPGTYVEEYWNLGSYNWNQNSPVPTKAVVTVTGTNNAGETVTKTVELSPLSEGAPSWPTYTSILPLSTGGAPQSFTASAQPAASRVQVLSSTTTTGDAGTEGDSDVLGVEGQSGTASSSTDKKADTKNAKATTCAKFLGVCWYYWVPVVLIVGFIVYYFFRAADENQTSTGK